MVKTGQTLEQLLQRGQPFTQSKMLYWINLECNLPVKKGIFSLAANIVVASGNDLFDNIQTKLVP
jgi:hypothetical protein